MAARKTIWAVLLTVLLLTLTALGRKAVCAPLDSLLPEIPGWTVQEKPQRFLPATLFEYINGAAEAYLSYDFKELIVAQYQNAMSGGSITVEIYDMGNERNSFGIYSSERYPESQFISVGNQGYLEEGTLNFVIGSVYVKLFCYDCRERSESVLKQFAQSITQRVGEKGDLPPLLALFPKEGLVGQSEKFVLRNVLGFGFFHDGYLASYHDNGLEFELFIIEGKNEAEAEHMLQQFLSASAKTNAAAREIPLGYHIRDRYAQNIYLSTKGKLIFGVMRIPDGSEETGLKYLQALSHGAEKSLR